MQSCSRSWNPPSFPFPVWCCLPLRVTLPLAFTVSQTETRSQRTVKIGGRFHTKDHTSHAPTAAAVEEVKSSGSKSPHTALLGALPLTHHSPSLASAHATQQHDADATIKRRKRTKAQRRHAHAQPLLEAIMQQPLPLPPRMRPPRAREDEAAVADTASVHEPRRGPHRHAADGPDRVAPVAARTRPPEPEPRARPGPYRAAEERAAREAAVAAMARAPEPRPKPGPYYAEEGRAGREDPVATMPRPPEPEPRPRPGPYSTTREDPVATMPRSPEPWPWTWPYYDVAERPVRPTSSSSTLASCLVATVFLLLAGGGAATALFLLFRPRPPDIAVAAVRLPSFAAANGTVAFTFEQMASVRNPNRAPLAHFDSSLRVAYAGGELGSVYIPAGLIDGGRSKEMSASFAVPAFAAAIPPPLEVAAQQPAAMAVMEVDSLLVVKGKVTVLRVLTHRVQASKICRVGVSPVDGTVLGFRC